MHWAAAIPVAVALLAVATAPANADANRRIIVRDGVLRWADDASEVALFGVNYYAPFSISYQALKRIGADHRQVIDHDVAHFARLGLTAIRLHVWDREISDPDGNLLDNDHLALLDYLIWRCKQRGIYTVLTPIAWWPSPENTSGFSDRFDMRQMTTDPVAIECQRRYLAQFVNHVNRYSSLAYKDDPAIAAIELINEPLYPPGTTDDQVVAYINALADAVRSTGCRKPIFFNCWGGRQRAVARSAADGASCGWYPTGLIAGHALWDNFLPRVAHYTSFGPGVLDGKPKIIYEFDAADVPGSYMYPAMARSFREAGAQIATQFQYDCLPLASHNFCWQTHFLNLVYAPAKAISFAIAAEAFRRLPRGASFGDYPQNSRFGPFAVSYEDDLSILADERTFMYSNDTDARPPAPERLERLWACGSSSLVRYDGTGAYFLDRLRPGCWRLEIYPDAVWVDDPYASPSPDREVSRLIWRQHTMTLRLPDLGADFSVRQLAPDRGQPSQARAGSFTVSPGVWLLVRRGVSPPQDVSAEFHCPRPPGHRKPAAWALVPPVWLRSQSCPVEVRAAAGAGPPEAVEIWLMTGRRVQRVALQQRRPYLFSGDLPARALDADEAAWAVALRDGDRLWALPWHDYLTPRQAAAQRRETFVLWQAGGRVPPVGYSGPQDAGARAEIVSDAGTAALRLEADRFGHQPSCAAIRLPASPPTRQLKLARWALCIEARALYPQTSRVEVSLVEADGTAHGAVFPLSTRWQKHAVPLTRLRNMWRTTGRLDLARVRQVAVVFGAWLYGPAAGQPHAFEIRRITLEPAGPQIIHLVGGPGVIPLVGPDALTAPAGPQPPKTPSVGVVAGSTPGRRALRLAGGPFGPPPDCVQIRFRPAAAFTRQQARRWHRLLADCRGIAITARAARPHTTAVEIVFIERDGTPWGTVLPLSGQWETTRLDLTDLEFFGHWQTAPPNRGRPGDRFHPEDLAQVSICFGAWLYPDHRAEAHAVDIEQIALTR